MDSETVLRNTRSFMEEARRAQLESGASLWGRPGLKEPLRAAIRAAATSCAVTAQPHRATLDIKIRLLERFEEMCRRQRTEVSAELRPAVLGVLLTELSANQRALKIKKSKLVAVTAYSGAVGPNLSAEFPDFADTPYIFTRAAEGSPCDPRGFLRNVQKNIEALTADEEFAAFRDTPGIFKYAATNSHTDPRGFLRNMQKNIEALTADEEFAAFRYTPSIFKQAAMNNCGDPRGYLRLVQRNIETLAGDEEFAAFRDTPGIFARAAVGNPGDPKGFLRNVQKNIAELATEEEFAACRDTPFIFTRAAVGNPIDPRAWLRRELKSNWHSRRVKNRRAPPQAAEEQDS